MARNTPPTCPFLSASGVISPVLSAMSRFFAPTCHGVSQCMSNARGGPSADGIGANWGRSGEWEAIGAADGAAEALAATLALGCEVGFAERGGRAGSSPHATSESDA